MESGPKMGTNEHAFQDLQSDFVFKAALSLVATRPISHLLRVINTLHRAQERTTRTRFAHPSARPGAPQSGGGLAPRHSLVTPGADRLARTCPPRADGETEEQESTGSCSCLTHWHLIGQSGPSGQSQGVWKYTRLCKVTRRRTRTQKGFEMMSPGHWGLTAEPEALSAGASCGPSATKEPRGYH